MQITFPPKMQRELGITSFTFKYEDAKEWIEEELEARDGNVVTFTTKFMLKTNKWIESLPEANI